MPSNVMVLLLLQAKDPDHADRAWSAMQTWAIPRSPGELHRQIDRALGLTRDIPPGGLTPRFALEDPLRDRTYAPAEITAGTTAEHQCTCRAVWPALLGHGSRCPRRQR